MVGHWPASKFLRSLASQYSTKSVIKHTNLLAEAGEDVLEVVKAGTAHDVRGVMSAAASAGMFLFRMATQHTQEIQDRMIANRTSPADVVRVPFVVF
jgi:hypothetical protein